MEPQRKNCNDKCNENGTATKKALKVTFVLRSFYKYRNEKELQRKKLHPLVVFQSVGQFLIAEMRSAP
jgi:hypothetical protein